MYWERSVSNDVYYNIWCRHPVCSSKCHFEQIFLFRIYSDTILILFSMLKDIQIWNLFFLLMFDSFFIGIWMSVNQHINFSFWFFFTKIYFYIVSLKKIWVIGSSTHWYYEKFRNYVEIVFCLISKLACFLWSVSQLW